MVGKAIKTIREKVGQGPYTIPKRGRHSKDSPSNPGSTSKTSHSPLPDLSEIGCKAIREIHFGGSDQPGQHYEVVTALTREHFIVTIVPRLIPSYKNRIEAVDENHWPLPEDCKHHNLLRWTWHTEIIKKEYFAIVSEYCNGGTVSSIPIHACNHI